MIFLPDRNDETMPLVSFFFVLDKPGKHQVSSVSMGPVGQLCIAMPHLKAKTCWNLLKLIGAYLNLLAECYFTFAAVFVAWSWNILTLIFLSTLPSSAYSSNFDIDCCFKCQGFVFQFKMLLLQLFYYLTDVQRTELMQPLTWWLNVKLLCFYEITIYGFPITIL